jgi:hypothetical protein
MANLNIPFLLLNGNTCDFTPNIGCAKILPYEKFNDRVEMKSTAYEDVSVNRNNFEDNRGIEISMNMASRRSTMIKKKKKSD